MRLYISGPMKGKPRFNFDLFYEAEEALHKLGHTTFNPARVDAEIHNIDPDTMTFKDDVIHMMPDLVRADVEGIIGSDGMVMLPGWQKSVGATAELAVSKWLGVNRPVYAYPDMCFLQDCDILSEAGFLISEDRQKGYGCSTADYARIAEMWSAMKGVEFEPKEVSMFFICAKLSCEMNRYKRDNAID